MTQIFPNKETPDFAPPVASNARAHALAIIGSDTLPQVTLAQVLDGINARFGGSTLIMGKGSWSEQGAEFTTHYDNVKFETAYQIEVCVPVVDWNLQEFQSFFKPVKGFATWIHVETWVTIAHHFNVNDL